MGTLLSASRRATGPDLLSEVAGQDLRGIGPKQRQTPAFTVPPLLPELHSDLFGALLQKGQNPQSLGTP